MQNLPQNAQGGALTTTPKVDPSYMAEELEGLGSISLDIVKIPAGGGIMFELPSDDPDNPDVTKDLTGVIVDHHAMNNFWASDFTGENVNPDCVSLDGKVGKDMHSGEMKNCASCPFNQFGSKGAGKACRNSHRLYILRDGDGLPLILNLPPSSLKTFKEYLAKRILLRGQKLSQVVTQITLKKAQSKSGITYSQASFAKVGDLTPEQIAEVAPMTALVKSIGRRYPDPINEDEAALNAQPVPGYTAPQRNGAPYKDARYTQAQAQETTFEEVDELPM